MTKREWAAITAIISAAIALFVSGWFYLSAKYKAEAERQQAEAAAFLAFKNEGHVRIIESAGFSESYYVGNDQFVPAHAQGCYFTNLHDGEFSWVRAKDGFWRIDYQITSQIDGRTKAVCPPKGIFYTRDIDGWLRAFQSEKQYGDDRAALIGRVAQK